jgi:hypothetical protein
LADVLHQLPLDPHRQAIGTTPTIFLLTIRQKFMSPPSSGGSHCLDVVAVVVAD